MSCQAILENPRDGEPYIIWYNRNIPLEFKDGELVGIDTFWHELWDNGIEPPLPELDEHEREAYAAGVIKGREFLLKRLQALLPDIPRGYKTTLYFGREYRTEHSMFKKVTERDIMFRFGVEGIWETGKDYDLLYENVKNVHYDSSNKVVELTTSNGKLYISAWKIHVWEV